MDFETAILNGRPSDGGLYVPTRLPGISLSMLQDWKDLSYVDLSFEILSLFIDRKTIPAKDLRQLINQSFSTFSHPESIPVCSMKSEKDKYIMELFHGPTLSFKDVAMGFVVSLFHYFLKRKKKEMTLVVATSGDTGPAAAYATIGKDSLSTWTLYPEAYITEEQERQMTTITAANVHAVRVKNCPNGSDDLDDLITAMFADQQLKKRLNLSSVNSINWGRVMMQTVHYFYGYLQVADRVGEAVNFAVPSGAFGNLAAGGIAREMGLPVGYFIIGNNKNTCLQRVFSEGIYLREKVQNSLSSAIDISAPLNFWRYLYFAAGQDTESIRAWMNLAEKKGEVVFDKNTHETFSQGFLTASVSDEDTLEKIRTVYEQESYLIDPHAAVALVAVDVNKNKLKEHVKTLYLATAHPAKFPAVIRQVFGKGDLPAASAHPALESVEKLCQKIYECDFKNMYEAVPKIMIQTTKGTS